VNGPLLQRDLARPCAERRSHELSWINLSGMLDGGADRRPAEDVHIAVYQSTVIRHIGLSPLLQAG